MCNEPEVEIDEEIQILFTEDIQILEDRLWYCACYGFARGTDQCSVTTHMWFLSRSSL